LADLIASERVTVTGGVPTVWNGVLQELEDHPRDLSSLRLVIVGGSAAPKAMIEAFDQRHGAPIVHAWGMTETGPLASVSRVPAGVGDLPQEERLRIRAKQGRVVPGVRCRVMAEDGSEVPWDGKSMGEVQVKGNWVAATYYND